MSRKLWVFLAMALAPLACAREQVGQISGPEPRRAVSLAKPGKVSTGCSDEDLRARARQVLNGLATYYSDSLSGHRTASGERYDPDQWSAAHRSLPFGTRLRVTRTDVASSSVSCVTINDRGPFSGRQRVLDLSRRAARELDMLRAGVARVRIEVL
jgi:rare lipoprotein A